MFRVTESPPTALAGQYEWDIQSIMFVSVPFGSFSENDCNILIDYSRTHIINENLLRESHLLLLMLTSVYPLWRMRLALVFGVSFVIGWGGLGTGLSVKLVQRAQRMHFE